MANAKNTIQNIPLTGELCLNTLKTDVKAFEGYNEKNSTVFGGELAPVWKKETELGDKDDTFTIFNSKGEPFTFSGDSVYDKDNNVIGKVGVPLEIPECAPEDAIWYSFLSDEQSRTRPAQLYIDSQGVLYLRVSSSDEYPSAIIIDDLLNTEYQRIYDFGVHNDQNTKILSVAASYGRINDYYDESDRQIYKYGLSVSIIYKSSDYYYYKTLFLYGINIPVYPNRLPAEIDLSKQLVITNQLPSFFTDSSFVVSKMSDDIYTAAHYYVSFVPFSGKKVPDSNDKVTIIDIEYLHSSDSVTNSIEGKDYFLLEARDDPVFRFPINGVWAELSGTPKSIEVWKAGSYVGYLVTGIHVSFHFIQNEADAGDITGHDGNYFIPGLKPSYEINPILYNTADFDTYIDGLLYSASFCGRLLRLPGEIDDFSYSHDTYSASFRDKDNVWHTYIGPNNPMGDYRTEYIYHSKNKRYILNAIKKYGIIDNRYISLIGNNFFDIETKKTTYCRLGYVYCSTPCTGGVISETTGGIIYMGGFNVNYPISGKPFVGLLRNPLVMTDFPQIDPVYCYFQPNIPSSIENFFSIGATVESAEYQGNNIDYKNTIYPIDVNGNIIYPITWDNQIINGYSNNDLIKVGDAAYPLIYWNNNQKMYAYYLLSSMENVKGAFSLQGQQYTFDDKNIYNVQFDNGVIQNVTSVCYIKNMQFLGTLPTSAVFYSKFNKTFYQFTGDAILSKMFEASDIDEIKMVGQNPSTLSLWICTDKGVYILSDTDMFKLDYDVSDIFFEGSKTIIVTEGETNWIENDISLYDIGNEATETPIKLQTKFYGLGGELKANYDCWYIRLHNKDRKSGKLKVKVNTMTNSSFETEEKTFTIEPNQYDSNNTVFIRYQPKYQSAVATQLELESDIAVYQLSLGVNNTDAVAQQSKFNF